METYMKDNLRMISLMVKVLDSDNEIGTYSYASGDKYVGHWKDGAKNGNGNPYFITLRNLHRH